MDSHLDLSTTRTISVAAEHTLMQRLAERRITPEVIATFLIEPRGEGWVYPTPRGALRFKNANSEAANKYAWICEKRDTLLYGFDLQEAIQMTGGEVWLTTEFDFFAMRSAGIFHTIAKIQGEGSVPDELPAMLQNMGVLVCHIAPDRDNQGTTWSQLVADRLIPVGIEVFARELPYPKEKKHGGDIGRLWQEYIRIQPFERYLLNLPVMRLRAKEREGKRKSAKLFSLNEDRRSEFERVKNEITCALGVNKFNGKGYSKNLRCPFHNDQKASASLHRDFGLHCFKCGWKRWKDLAEHFGLDWVTTAVFTPTRPHMALGDELIQAMVKAGYSALASTLDLAYRAGWMPKQEITVKSLIALGIPKWRARKAFAQMDGKESDKRKQNKRGKRGKRESIYCGELATFFLFPEEALILNKNSRRGRPAKVKVLPNPNDLARVFGVDVTHYTKIAQKSNIADWRAEVYALQIDRDPGTYPRKELCKPLGISPTTARAYDKRARVIVTPNQKRTELKSADELPDTPEFKATWLETEDVITDKNGRQKFRQFMATKAGYARALKNATKHGRHVWMVKQLANDYRRTEE